MSETELKVIKKVTEWLGKLPLKARLRVLGYLLETAEDERQELADERQEKLAFEEPLTPVTTVPAAHPSLGMD